MLSQSEYISDRHIIDLLQENNLEAWKLLYDKYAASMYGMICKLTDDESIAGEIFKEAFLQLKDNHILSKTNYSLCPFLLRHTYNYAIKQLKQFGMQIKPLTPIEEASLIHFLCTQSVSLPEVSSILNMSEEETRVKLRHEFLNLRNQRKT
ncbi:MAG: hypothetical protein M3Q95_14830 [Bacteroidota bacterium]|nr:hypothetical protein [Bacteroidota bacterium]